MLRPICPIRRGNSENLSIQPELDALWLDTWDDGLANGQRFRHETKNSVSRIAAFFRILFRSADRWLIIAGLSFLCFVFDCEMMFQPDRTWTGLFLIAAAAGFGLLLIFVPSFLLDQADKIQQFGTFWTIVYFLVIGTGAVVFLGSIGHLIYRLYRRTEVKKERLVVRDKSPSELSLDQRQVQIRENVQEIGTLDQELGEDVKQELAPLLRSFESKQDAQRLEIVAFGSISSGKSSILNLLAGRPVFQTDIKGGTTIRRNEIPWPGNDQVILVDTPGLGEIDGAEHIKESAAAAENADIVLLVVDGPLRDSEFRLVKTLSEMEKRLVICLNKSDWYNPQDQERLREQLAAQTAGFVKLEDIVTVQGNAGQRTRVTVKLDGQRIEEAVEMPPSLQKLADRLNAIVRRDGKDLLLANLLLQSRGLLDNAKQRVRESLDKKAWAVIDSWALGAGSVAALPFPIIDIAAGVAINTKMVVDLAKIYHQDIDLNSAALLIRELGKNLIAILGSTAIVSVIASLLKTVPGVNLASGLVQGVVQALITRWIGAVFMEYFKNEMKEPEGGLAGLAKRQWKKMTTITELKKLVDTARQALANRG